MFSLDRFWLSVFFWWWWWGGIHHIPPSTFSALSFGYPALYRRLCREPVLWAPDTLSKIAEFRERIGKGA